MGAAERPDVRRFPTPHVAGNDNKIDPGAGGNVARAAGDLGAMEGVPPAVVIVHFPEADGDVKRSDHAGTAGGAGQWTILASDNSMMSVAPWSLRAGISVLMSDFGTTVSTA